MGQSSQAEAEDQGREAMRAYSFHLWVQSLSGLWDCSGQGVPAHPESEQQSLQNSATGQASLPAGLLQLSAQICWEGQQGPRSSEKSLEMQPQACLPSVIRIAAVTVLTFGKGFVLFKHFGQSTSCSALSDH